MTTTTKQICIKKDSQHVEAMTRHFEEAVKNVEQAIKQFENLTGRKMTVEDYPKFMQKPAEYTKQVLEDAIDVPSGFKKTEYLRMCEFPGTAHLDNMLSDRISVNGYPTCITTADFIQYDGENVVLTDSADGLITLNNTYVDDSPKYRDLLKFLKCANTMLQHDSDFASNFDWRHSDVFRYDHDTRQMTLHPEGLSRFLSPRR